MVETDKKTAVVAGVGITAAAAALLWASQKVEAKGPGGFDEAAMETLISILQHTENLDADTTTLINTLNQLAAAFGVGPLENPLDITAFTAYPPALITPVRLPYREVPWDKELVIKALHTNTGVILVAPSQAAARNINSSYWLIANEAIEYRIKNADHIWIGLHPALGFAGDGVVCTVEQGASR